MSSGKWTREDLQWALYVVKRYAVRVRRQTNAKPFLRYNDRGRWPPRYVGAQGDRLTETKPGKAQHLTAAELHEHAL